MRRSIVTALAVAIVVSAPAGAASAPGPLEPAGGALFGAYVKPLTGWNRDDVEAAIADLEAQLGRRLGIDHHYYPWHVAFPSWKEPWDLQHGRIPMITWGSVSTAKVNSGALDEIIRSRALGIRALEGPVFLRWFAEMDGDFHDELAVSPASYVRAWRRVRWIFAEAGAWNAVWVWCPTAWGFTEGSAQAHYPGDAYVDWVCADGYNWAPAAPGTSGAPSTRSIETSTRSARRTASQ